MPENNIVIILGGQTGVDRAALDFALHNNLLCRGWCPLGRLAEDGVLKPVYPLNETFSSDPKIRTEMNVLNSDGTLIIIFDEMDEGTRFAFDIANHNFKPVFVWELLKKTNPQHFKNWLKKNRLETLNIAGPRESFSPGIYEETICLLGSLLDDFVR